MGKKPFNILFLVEDNLGHRTHLRSLKDHISPACGINPQWVPVEPYALDVWSRLPYIRHQTPLSWSGRAAGRILAARRRGEPIDLIYLHTVNIALAARFVARRIPLIISLDGTPEPSETFQTYRGKLKVPAPLSAARDFLYRSALRSATGLVGFSAWVAESLLRHYEIQPDRVHVFGSGINLDLWSAIERRPSERPRILFVGGDFERKGGDRLLRVWRARLRTVCDLDIVSKTAPHSLASEPGIRLFRELAADSPELTRVFAEASVFALPTRGDTLPFVIMEAMASGLPVVSTRVGGIPSMVQEGKTGYLTDVDDDVALGHRLLELVSTPDRAHDMGRAARIAAQQQFDARENYNQLGRYLASVAERFAQERQRT